MAAADPAARVLNAAVTIARHSTARQGKYVSHARVYWPELRELRDALDELGVEWRKPGG